MRLPTTSKWMERDKIGEAHMFCRGVAFAATVQHAREKLKPSEKKWWLMQNLCRTYAKLMHRVSDASQALRVELFPSACARLFTPN